jgi:hypothetical protein
VAEAAASLEPQSAQLSRPESEAEKQIKAIRVMFADLDHDHNGKLDCAEFCALLGAIWEKFHRSPENKDHLLDRMVDRLFDEDEGGEANCDEMFGIIGDDPWNKTLPRHLRDDFKVYAQKLVVDGKLDPSGLAPDEEVEERKRHRARPHPPKLWPYNIAPCGEIKVYQKPSTSTVRARVKLYKNDAGKTRQYVVCMVQSLGQICDDATRFLHTPFACKRLFTMQGKEFLPFYSNDSGAPAGGPGTGTDVQDVVDGQSLVVSEGEDFKQRQGYANDGVTKKRVSPMKASKASRTEADGQFMPFMRTSDTRGELILDKEKWTREQFLQKLGSAPETDDPMIDRIINSMRDFYTLEDKLAKGKTAPKYKPMQESDCSQERNEDED